MKLEDRLKRSLTQRKDDVFVRSEFSQFGSQSQVTRVLKQLVAEGTLVKLGIGIYAKAKKSVLTGKPIPVRPVDVLASQALAKLGVAVGPSQLTKAYNGRVSTQIPAGTVLNTGNKKITRQIGFGGRFVKYETTARSSG
jgi:hypothetical protein